MKTFVLDTSVLLFDPSSIFKFGKNIVQIPLVVIEELDRFKKDPNENGRNARAFARYIDDLRKQGNISEGIDLEGGGKLLVSVGRPSADTTPSFIDLNINDNIILESALKVRANGGEVFLISKDINLRVKSDVLGVPSEDYGKQDITLEEMYMGFRSLEVSRERLSEFEANRFLPLDEKETGELGANEYLVLEEENNPGHRLLGRYSSKKNGVVPLIRVREGVWGIYPKNIEQQFAFDALLNNEIKLVSLVGKAGTGKTLLAISAGLELTLNQQDYTRLLVSRPVMPMGRDLGFLPGDVNEKLAPWMQPIFDNLDFLFDTKAGGNNSANWEDLINQGILHVEPLTYIRGRSIPNQYLIVDEAQNLSPHEIKTIITRAGEGTKIVLTGDCEQIDSPYLDSVNNGLAYCVDRLKGESIMAHTTLKVGERSPLSEIASKLL